VRICTDLLDLADSYRRQWEELVCLSRVLQIQCAGQSYACRKVCGGFLARPYDRWFFDECRPAQETFCNCRAVIADQEKNLFGLRFVFQVLCAGELVLFPRCSPDATCRPGLHLLQSTWKQGKFFLTSSVLLGRHFVAVALLWPTMKSTCFFSLFYKGLRGSRLCLLRSNSLGLDLAWFIVVKVNQRIFVRR
jgi:hypothetical protein